MPIACGVSGHDADGMWDTLVVSATAKAPTVTVTVTVTVKP